MSRMPVVAFNLPDQSKVAEGVRMDEHIEQSTEPPLQDVLSFVRESAGRRRVPVLVWYQRDNDYSA